jgi:hypothetical protein
VGEAAAGRAVGLCHWLVSVELPDGGLSFALPVPDPAACAPFRAGADSGTSSLQITCIVVVPAHRAAARIPALAFQPWPATATRYCLTAISELTTAPHPMELAFGVQFLDVAAAARSDAPIDRELHGPRQDGGLHLGGQPGVGLAGRPAQFLGQGPGPRPVERPVGRRPTWWAAARPA